MISYHYAKKIDRFLRASIIAFIFIGLRRIVNKFAKKIDQQSVDTIYVVKLLGGGSLCILMPYLAELKSKREVRLILVSTRVCTVFSDELALFDETLNLDTKADILKFFRIVFENLYKRLVAKNNTASINFEFHSAVTAYISSLFFSPINCGVTNNFSIAFSKIYEKSVFYNGHANVANAYKRLIEQVFDSDDLVPVEKSKSAICNYVERLEQNISLDQYGVMGEYIALSPFSSGLSAERELSYDQILGAVLNLNLNKIPIYILGSKADQKRADHLIRRFSSDSSGLSIYSLCGKLSIGASAKLARKAIVYITIDSGLNHYVRMTYAKLIQSYWGPTDPQIMLDDHFFQGREVVHYRKIYCSPCVHIVDRAPCNGKNICIDGLFNHDK